MQNAANTRKRPNDQLWSECAIYLTITLALSFSSLPTTWALSDQRLCADEKCERIISMGISKIKYIGSEDGMLSFKINSPVRIMSKSAGSNPKLWGVEINGRRGYANKDFIMEKKININEKDLKFTVPVVWPPTSATPAAATPAAAAAPPPAAAAVPAEQAPPVLNASEATDELSTTTTSPLDTLQLSILTEQDQASSSEASTPITPVQPNLQVVDGTELPLDSLSSVGEREREHNQSKSALDEAKPVAAEQLAAPTATNDDDYEFDDYEEEEVYEDDDESLDSKANEVKVDVMAQKLDEAPVKVDNVKTEQLSTEEVASSVTQKPTLETVDKVEAVVDAIVDSKQNETEPAVNAAFISITETTTTENTANGEQPKIEQVKPVEQLIELPKVAVPKDKEVPIASPPTPVEAPIVEPSVSETEKLKLPEAEFEKVEDVVDQANATSVEAGKPEEKLSNTTEAQTKPAEEAVNATQQQPQNDTESQVADPLVEKPKPQNLTTEAKDASELQGTAAKPNETADQPQVEEIVAPAKPQPMDAVESTTSMPSERISVPASLPPLFKKQQFKDPNEYYKQLQEQQQLKQQQQQEQREKHDQHQEEQEQREKQVQMQKEQEQREKQEKQDQQERQERERLEQEQREKQEREKEEEAQRQRQEREQKAEELRQREEEQRQLSMEQTTPTPDTKQAYDDIYEATATPAPPKEPESLVSSGAVGSVEPLALPTTSPEAIKEDAGLSLGLFSTIMDTVNSFISNQGDKPAEEPAGHDELHRLLYPDAPVPAAIQSGQAEAPQGHCERTMSPNCHASISLDNFAEVLAAKILDNSLLLACVVIAAASSLFFICAYYCCCNSSQEGALLSKLNHLERSLLASHKENLLVKHELTHTRNKLASIEDNSFGSNDMVAALKKELETELYEKGKLQEQVSALEKDLDNAAEAGLELNKMLSEVLNGQNGDEAFMSTVEELQRQLNDQEKIIIEINGSLAEKSRENSEMQYTYTESTARLTSEMQTLQQDNYELEMEKAKLQTRIEEMQAETEQELAKALEARNYEMQRLQQQIMELTAKHDQTQSELQTSLAKIEALEEALSALKKGSNANIQELISSAKSRGELNAAQQKFVALQAKLEQEVGAKARVESQLQQSSSDVEQLKQDFNQSERDKLEAQTRLEVLSGYFREKETQLQKELSLQEAKWLQHQGENASTVETQTLMKNEIQTLKSQNDELRAEIEAQIASHKAQMGTLENRAHESWLAARQSERRCEEALAEAAGLRRKLTAMASGSVSDILLDATATELNNAPSPLPLPGSPGLLNMPNALPFLPAPFSPFMGLPPPFLPPAGAGVGGARPPPLGRMRSPPPTTRDDYSDYDDYDEEDDDDRGMDRSRRHSGSWGREHHHHRDHYMHSPRTYRSLSPSDSRYNYNDTETDFSPPPSPPPPARHKSSRTHNEV